MDPDKILEKIDFSMVDNDIKAALLALINLVEEKTAQLNEANHEIQRLRDEINRLKGEQGKPHIKPRTAKNQDISSEKERQRHNKANTKSNGTKSARIKIDKTIDCPVDQKILPEDAEFKGYKRTISQDIEIKTNNIEYKREVYYSPSERKSYIAPLPDNYQGEFSLRLKAYVSIFKNICNMSESKIQELLSHIGIQISAGTISNMLIKEHEACHQEKSEIVDAGLKSSTYQGTDDTKARVNGQNYHTHILGNPYFTAFFTKPAKNRFAVLEVLSNDKELTYCLNDLAITILTQLTIAKTYFQELVKMTSEKIYSPPEFEHLILQRFPSITAPVKSKILEAAAIAAYRQGVDRPVTNILLCDDAPQFKLICFGLAACWVHDGRHYKKLMPTFRYNAHLVQQFLQKYWTCYHELLDYKQAPSTQQAEKLSNQFDQLFSTVTGYKDLDDRIAKTKAKKGQLLFVLKYPELPLHNNDMELGARVCARKRDVSLHTMTADGTKANDTFLTIIETCKKLGVNPFQYILDRIQRTYQLSPLAQLISNKCQELAPVIVS
jgi:hypothetical protein